MTIKTKFNEEDTVFTIDQTTFRLKGFKVKRISTSTVNGKTSVTLYDGESYSANGYDENKCFVTEKELMDFITTPHEPKTL